MSGRYASYWNAFLLPLQLGFELTGYVTFFAFSLSTLPILNYFLSYLYLDIFSSR